MKLFKRLMLEQLEDRCLFAVLGVPWPEANKITLSFAPDGTIAGDKPSELFSALNPRLAGQAWQTEILRAAQTWVAESNINIGLVSDSGQPFQSLGFKQGDLRFGDIRVGAVPMGDDVLAVANPYDPFVVNAWVGDIFLNSNLNFDVGSTENDYDLYSVMLHEMGHVLGIGHSDDPSSPMYGEFHDVESGLTAAEIASIRQLYGARKPDAYDAAHANDTLESATPLTFDPYGETELAADITRSDDVDIYRLVMPEGASSLHVDLHTAGLSMLEARLSIVDASGRVLAAAAASDPRQNDVSIDLGELAKLSSGSSLYVRVESADADAFAVGAYELEVRADQSASQPPSDDAAAPTNPGGMPEALDAAQVRQAELLATTPGYVEHTYYEIDAELSNLHPEHVYRVRSADIGPDMNNVMTVIVDTYGSHNVQTAIYDDAGNLLPLRIIAQTDDEIALQIENVASNRDYFVRVHGENYVREAEVEVEVDFAHDSTHLEQLVTGSLAAGEDEFTQQLAIGSSELVHWVLSASDWSQAQETGVEMQLVDATGNIVYSLAAQDGASRSGETFLNAGSYTARFARSSGDTHTPVIFKLSGMTTSSPIGPQLRDTTRTPVDSNGNARTQLLSYWLPTAPSSLSASSVPGSMSNMPGAGAVSFGPTLQPIAQVRAAADASDRPQLPLSVKSSLTR
ncbi:MAG: matrixin family metalloprotease, partial [Aureliella sp.]